MISPRYPGPQQPPETRRLPEQRVVVCDAGELRVYDTAYSIEQGKVVGREAEERYGPKSCPRLMSAANWMRTHPPAKED